MTPRQIVTFLFLYATLGLFSQSDTLNKFNSKGKKHGYWIQYLDQTVSPVDSLNSYFFGYEFYDNGEKIFVYFKDWWVDKGTFSYDGPLPTKGQPRLLAGTFTWVEKKEPRNKAIEIYKNGYPFTLINYSYTRTWDTVSIGEFIDYSRRYNNIVGTYYFENHFVHKAPKKFWFRKGDRRWRAFKIVD